MLKKEKKTKNHGMRKIASGIVKSRYVLFLLFLLAGIYAALSIGRVKINNDITSFLPADTDTRKGLTVMEDEFITYATANVMLSNVPYERAADVASEIAKIPHVTDAVFDDTEAHYNKSSALISVSFDGEAMDKPVVEAMNKIRDIIAPYDTYVTTQVGVDFTGEIIAEMGGVMLIAMVIIIGVLLLTSRSYFEVVIFLIVFAVAALLNMGTNYWFGEISSITNSIAVILQLALAIDYAIIFSHRYQDEAAKQEDTKEALIDALAKSITEISSSSLTTISGLVALTLMQFRLGYDLGMVLTKGILFSMLTVFLLMPGLILLFPKPLAKTAHKNLIPDIGGWGKVLMKSKVAFVILFAMILPFAIYGSGHAVYSFDDSSIDELVESDSRVAMHKIKDTFDNATPVAILVPSGHYDYEKAILQEVSQMEEIDSTLGLASIEIEEGHVLTDLYTPRMFSLLVNVDYETARLLYQGYGIEHDQYQSIVGNAEEYAVPLIDMFLYLFEKVDQGIVPLPDEVLDMMTPLRGMMERGVVQLRGTDWNRMLLTANVPVEGEESIALVDNVRSIAEKYYGEGNVLVVGMITSARDLAASFNGDSGKINFLTIAFVFLILLFTFRSLVGALTLVFVIQGSIWINFAFTFLMGSHPSFVTYMIVSAIQMGATIDYAIVLMNRYQALKEFYPPKEAMIHAVSESFPTVFTSGSILTMAGLLISFRVSDVYIGHIGLAVGRGAIISIILVLTVLPQLIVLLDKAITKTTFKIHVKMKWKEDADETDQADETK